MQRTHYSELMPALEWQPFIKCFWIASNDSDAAVHSTTLPDGCFEIVVIYRKQVLYEVILSGILTAPFDIVMASGELKFGIRIQPLGKEYYLDRIPGLSRFGEFTKNLSGELPVDLTLFSRSVTADLKDIVSLRTLDKRKLILFDLLRKNNGNIGVASLAAYSHWSSRQINRYFNKFLGSPLKTYSDLLKCYAAYPEIKAGHLNPDLGHCDQSHFIRAIKRFTGTTPKMLLKNEDQRYLQFNEAGRICE